MHFFSHASSLIIARRISAKIWSSLVGILGGIEGCTACAYLVTAYVPSGRRFRFNPGLYIYPCCAWGPLQIRYGTDRNLSPRDTPPGTVPTSPPPVHYPCSPILFPGLLAWGKLCGHVLQTQLHHCCHDIISVHIPFWCFQVHVKVLFRQHIIPVGAVADGRDYALYG